MKVDINTFMKQRQLIHEMYAACLAHDNKRLLELQTEEFRKIMKRKLSGKSVAKHKYTIIR